jgi:hypothetical protein
MSFHRRVKCPLQIEQLQQHNQHGINMWSIGGERVMKMERRNRGRKNKNVHHNTIDVVESKGRHWRPRK